MKRIIILIILVIVLAFLLPICFTKRFEYKQVSAEDNQENNISKYEYSNYGEVRVLHKNTNEIEVMNLDDYLLGVVSAEMPADFEIEALKAQAVVARTYTIFSIINNQGKHEGADICDDSKCCQAWISKEDRLERWDEGVKDSNWEKINIAVFSTQGKIITYDGNPIDAFFHANSGGKTEEVINVWGGSNLPYLKSVETSGEADYQQYFSEVLISKKEFEEKIKQKYPDFYIDYNDKESIKILEYTDGNRVKTIKIGNINMSGVEVRTLLELKSANFDYSIEGDNIKFEVKGYGHGVGMSQTGANSMAKEGKTYEDIIKHFYTDIEIVNI